MDPISIVAAGLLVRALQDFAGEAGRTSWTAVRDALARVRTRLRGDELARAALAAAEETPEDETRTQQLAATIDRLAAQDEDFRREVSALVAAARRDPAAARFVTEVSGHAHVEKIVNIENARDVSF
jgi:hypothetical protein